jgi:predicted esterase
LTAETTLPGGAPQRTELAPLLPLGLRKYAIRLSGPAAAAPGDGPVTLRLLRPQQDGTWQTIDTAELKLQAVAPDRTHRRTFRSGIDDSLQYYAVVPPKGQSLEGASGAPAAPGAGRARKALVLTLHGAGVEALGQAASYAAKDWAYIVAPTNRRPFGFDWEDWGRRDAIEVLDLVQKRYDTDPPRTYLTGHSMGGHGVWHVGVTYPDRFAAIGPSAGWISMWSYAAARRGEPGSSIAELLQRGMTPSDTLALSANYQQHGIYVLHGEKDDNVPVEQARTMRQHLEGFHKDFAYHEEPGMGHWWGKEGISGAACVDWPPMFEFFQKHTQPPRATVWRVQFATANPAVSAWCHWLGIESQIEPLKPSTANVQYEAESRRFSGTTHNVARLALDLGHLAPGKPVHVALDGQPASEVTWPAAGARVWLVRSTSKPGGGDAWSAVDVPSAALKGPHRSGPFKEAFGQRVLFVYGTRGTPEENAWAMARARYDAERFWYQGNASIDVLGDTEFDTNQHPDRSVIVYGNADTNSAWQRLLSASPIQVKRGVVTLEDNRALAGILTPSRDSRAIVDDDLCCLFVRPRPASDRALVGVVSGTGIAGLRLSERLPYFTSGVAYPDYLILGAETLTRGADGIWAAGYFGPDWSLRWGVLAWRDR